MLCVNKVSLSKDNVAVLTEVSLNCAPHTVTVLMGPNGAGKTSLLNIISGEYRADSGDIRFKSTLLSTWSLADRARVMAVLPQYSRLDFPFSVEEVVLLGRTPHATGRKHDRDIVKAALAKVDASYLATRFYTQLSGGEKQRVQLARVLAQVWFCHEYPAPLLLLDEPSASLDIEHQQLLRTIVQDFAHQGGAVVMVMHDLNLAAACADQLVMMNCGQISAAGTPEQLLRADIIQQVFSVSAEVITHPLTGKPLVVL